jgi:hypothetical protein
MKTKILEYLMQLGWLKRQALKAAGYVSAMFTPWALGKLAALYEQGLIGDEGLAHATQAVSAVGVLVAALFVVGSEALASWFAKSRKE